MKSIAKTRFDARITVEQKELFEYAALLAGFRTLTDFVLHSAKTQADKIVEKHNVILESKRDQMIFFSALANPPKPGAKLKAAGKKYRELVAK